MFELDSNRALFVVQSRARKKQSAGGRAAPKLDTRRIAKIYIFINKIPRVVYRILGGFFKIFIFPTLGRYLQTSALKAAGDKLLMNKFIGENFGGGLTLKDVIS